MPTHTIQDGQCCLSVAARFGFAWGDIWDHPRNAELKKKRRDPNVLRAGDELYIPQRRTREVPCATGDVHRFVCKEQQGRLRLRVVEDPSLEQPAPQSKHITDEDNLWVEIEEPDPDLELDEQPREGAPYRLEIDGRVVRKGRTDAHGLIDVPIPAGAKKGTLVLDPDTAREDEIPLLLGRLNPMDTVSGVKQRLNNLGFCCGEDGDEETDDLALAIIDFQAAHGLEVTGELSDETQDALQKAHGA